MVATAQDQGIAWLVQTHEHQERTNDWYWALGLGAFAAMGISIFFGNWMLAIIVVLAAGSVGILVARGPREHWVRVDQRGISLDGTLYPYRSVRSFWVEQEVEYPRLLITTSGILHPQLVIPLEDKTRAQGVRSYLKKYAEEEEQHPHLGEHIAQLIGL